MTHCLRTHLGDTITLECSDGGMASDALEGRPALAASDAVCLGRARTGPLLVSRAACWSFERDSTFMRVSAADGLPAALASQEQQKASFVWTSTTVFYW